MASSAYELLEAYVNLTSRGVSSTLAELKAVQAATIAATSQPATIGVQVNATQALQQLQAFMSQLERTASQASRVNVVMAEVATTTSRVASAPINIVNPTQLFNMEQGSLAIAGLIGGLTALGLASAAAQGAWSLFVAGFARAGEIENASVSLQAVIGNAEQASQVFEDLRQLQHNSPFEFKDLAQSATRLKALGVETENVVDILRRMSIIATVVGSNVNLIAKAYTDVLANGRLLGPELRQFNNAAVPLGQTLADMLETDREGVEKIAKTAGISAELVTDALKKMTAEGSKFAESFERVNNTLPNVLAGISKESKDIAANFAGWTVSGIVPELTALRAVLQDVNDLTRGKSGGANNAPDPLKTAASMDVLDGALNTVGLGWLTVARAVAQYFGEIERGKKIEQAQAEESIAAWKTRQEVIAATAFKAEESAQKTVDAWNKAIEASDKRFARLWEQFSSRQKQEADKQLSDTIRAVEDDARIGDAFRKNLRTPMEIFTDSVREAQEALTKGLIDEATFGRAFKAANVELDQMQKKVQRISAVRTLFVLGTSEAFTFKLEQNQQQDRQLSEARQQTRQDADRNRILNDIRTAVQKQSEQPKAEVTANNFPGSDIF